MALMDFFPRSASVRAVADCQALALSPADLLRLFERDAEQFALIQMNMGREVSRRLRETDELLFRARMNEARHAGDWDTETVFRAT
jgi:CRP-like cAMP-binding protein